MLTGGTGRCAAYELHDLFSSEDDCAHDDAQQPCPSDMNGLCPRM